MLGSQNSIVGVSRAAAVSGSIFLVLLVSPTSRLSLIPRLLPLGSFHPMQPVQLGSFGSVDLSAAANDAKLQLDREKEEKKEVARFRIRIKDAVFVL